MDLTGKGSLQRCDQPTTYAPDDSTLPVSVHHAACVMHSVVCLTTWGELGNSPEQVPQVATGRGTVELVLGWDWPLHVYDVTLLFWNHPYDLRGLPRQHHVTCVRASSTERERIAKTGALCSHRVVLDTAFAAKACPMQIHDVFSFL